MRPIGLQAHLIMPELLQLTQLVIFFRRCLNIYANSLLLEHSATSPHFLSMRITREKSWAENKITSQKKYVIKMVVLSIHNRIIHLHPDQDCGLQDSLLAQTHDDKLPLGLTSASWLFFQLCFNPPYSSGIVGFSSLLPCI